MTYPQHPDTIVVRNKYYPNGLTEMDVWRYYQKVKWKLIKDLNNRTVFFDIAVDTNQTIIRRKGKEGQFFYINSRNYDDIITGRTLGIHGVMNISENIGIIDIDIDNLDLAKQAAKDVYDFTQSGKIPFIVDSHIRFTGKTSFHVFCILSRRKNIDITRILFRKYLSESDLVRRYTIESRRRQGIPNLDLASNKINGGFINLYSLSILGLPCTIINPKDIFKFRPDQLKIETKNK